MSYNGNTYRIDYSQSIWNANPNINNLKPNEMIDMLNINLHRGAIEPRGGSKRVNGNTISLVPEIKGVFQFIKENGNTFIIVGTSDGRIISNYTTELKTSLTVNRDYQFEMMNDTVFICNGVSRPQTWDGAAGTTSDITSIPADWTGTNYPKQLIRHGKGNSQRLWALGFVDGSVYASKSGDAQDFSDANVKKISIYTGDGYGIIGGVEFMDNLICFGKRQSYIIDDSSLTVADWGYHEAVWRGGAASHKLICRTPNDVIVMSDDMEIYSITTVQASGDYKTASLTRPTYINNWIKDNIDETQIDKFHMIYDPELRAVRVFMVRNGQTQIDTCLLYFIERGSWTRHQYVAPIASCSTLARVSAGTEKIYTGGYDGFVEQLEVNDDITDSGEAYEASITTSYMDLDNPRVHKMFDNIWTTIKPQANEQIKVNIGIDGVTLSGIYFLVTSSGDFIVTNSGDYIVTGAIADGWIITAVTPNHAVQDSNFRLGAYGKRIQLKIYNGESEIILLADENGNYIGDETGNQIGGIETTNNFLISQSLIDHRILGAKPAA